MGVWNADTITDVLTIVANHPPGRIAQETFRQSKTEAWEARHETWDRIRAKHKSQLRPELLDTLHQYATSMHQEINACLRGEDARCSESVNYAISGIQECLAIVGPTTEELTVYRGVPADKDLCPCAPKPHFLSCTWNPYEAISFSNNRAAIGEFTWGVGRVMLEIRLPPGSKVCAFQAGYTNEGEYLLPSNVQFEVRGDDFIYGGRLILLTALLPGTQLYKLGEPSG